MPNDSSTCCAAPRDASNPPPGASSSGPAGRAASDVATQSRHRWRGSRLGLEPADPASAPDRRPLRHQRLDGTPVPPPPAVHPGPRPPRGADRVVRLRDPPDPGHPPPPRTGSRRGAPPGRRRGDRLGRRDADRRFVPRLQPALGAPGAADERHRHRHLGWLGSRRPGARRGRDGAPPAQLPPAHLAQPAGRRRGLRTPGRRDEGRLPVHRRFRRRRHARQPRAARGLLDAPTRLEAAADAARRRRRPLGVARRARRTIGFTRRTGTRRGGGTDVAATRHGPWIATKAIGPRRTGRSPRRPRCANSSRR